MPLIGLPTLAVAATVAYLYGNERTRPFTSLAFWAVLAVEIGLVDALAWMTTGLVHTLGGLA